MIIIDTSNAADLIFCHENSGNRAVYRAFETIFANFDTHFIPSSNLVISDLIALYNWLTLSSLNLPLHCHLHLLQAANCLRNSRLEVDEDDLMWFKN